MEPDPLRRLDDHQANLSLSIRALHAHIKATLPPSATHRVAFARELDGIRAVCTDCLGKGFGPTVEAARASILADLRRLAAERLAAATPPDLWEETLTLDEEPPA